MAIDNVEKPKAMHTRASISRTNQQPLKTRDSHHNVVEAQPSEEEILRKPWKFVGYNGYARFTASDDEIFILRRFSTLSARITLSLQDEVSALEEKLMGLDETHSRRNDDVHNGTFRNDLEDRKAMHKILAEKLRQYSE